MKTQKLNDREEQVCLAALKNFMSHLLFWSKGKFYVPLNDLDILDPGHSKAHVITAMQKLSGQPITHSFQSPSPEQTTARINKRAQAEAEIRAACYIGRLTHKEIDQLLEDLKS